MTRLLRCAAVAVAVFGLDVQHAVGAENSWSAKSVGYGIFDGANEARSWVVIDDQAIGYGPGLVIRDDAGRRIASPQGISIGTPVKYVRSLYTRSMPVVKIRVLDELPTILDEEGVPER
jgi:hypothetical protein